MPGAQQSTADQIINISLINREARLFGRDPSGNDGMMIANLGVIDESPPQGVFAGPGCEKSAIRRLDPLNDPRQGPRDIFRQISAVRAGIANHLVTLVERLCEIECFLGTEPKQSIGMTLQLGQV